VRLYRADLQKKLSSGIVQRLRDKIPSVRGAAVLAAEHLPADNIMEALVQLMAVDTNKFVIPSFHSLSSIPMHANSCCVCVSNSDNKLLFFFWGNRLNFISLGMCEKMPCVRSPSTQ
jgi:hypothetical protein